MRATLNLQSICLLTACLLILSTPAKAQDVPRVEVFGGYSYARVDGPTAFLSLGGIFLELGDFETANTNGFHVAVAENKNDWFGGALEVSGHYGSPTVEDVFETKTSLYTVLAGPRFSFRKSKTVVPFVHALVGVAHLNVHHEIDGIILPSRSETGFAAALGGGVDVALSDRIAIRVVQADYMPIRIPGFSLDLATLDFGFTGPNRWLHNIRASAGIVFRFGKT